MLKFPQLDGVGRGRWIDRLDWRKLACIVLSSRLRAGTSAFKKKRDEKKKVRPCAQHRLCFILPLHVWSRVVSAGPGMIYCVYDFSTLCPRKEGVKGGLAVDTGSILLQVVLLQ